VYVRGETEEGSEKHRSDVGVKILMRSDCVCVYIGVYVCMCMVKRKKVLRSIGLMWA
jgi:hypothetical protein